VVLTDPWVKSSTIAKTTKTLNHSETTDDDERPSASPSVCRGDATVRRAHHPHYGYMKTESFGC